jgi:hypothetical protein
MTARLLSTVCGSPKDASIARSTSAIRPDRCGGGRELVIRAQRRRRGRQFRRSSGRRRQTRPCLRSRRTQGSPGSRCCRLPSSRGVPNRTAPCLVVSCSHSGSGDPFEGPASHRRPCGLGLLGHDGITSRLKHFWGQGHYCFELLRTHLWSGSRYRDRVILPAGSHAE